MIKRSTFFRTLIFLLSFALVNQVTAQTTTMKELLITVNKIELQIRDYSHKGEVIIFLHSAGDNLKMWENIVPHFREHYRLILIDFKGHGKSERIESGFHIDTLSSEIKGVMNYLNIDSAHIVGSSMGAMVGLSLGAKYPQSVKSLFLESDIISTFGPYSSFKGTSEDFKQLKAHIKESVRNEPLDTYPTIEGLVNSQHKDNNGSSSPIDAVTKYGAYEITTGKYAYGFTNKQREDYMTHFLDYRFEEYFSKISSPLMIFGGEDDFGNTEIIDIQNKLLKLAKNSGTLLVVNGWEHSDGWILTPEKVKGKLKGFIQDANKSD